MCTQPGVALTVSLILFIVSCFAAVAAVELGDIQAKRSVIVLFEYIALISFLLLIVVVSTTLLWGCRW